MRPLRFTPRPGVASQAAQTDTPGPQQVQRQPAAQLPDTPPPTPPVGAFAKGTVGHLWGCMLRALPDVGPVAATAVLQAYPTCAALCAALDAAGPGGPLLLTQLKVRGCLRCFDPCVGNICTLPYLFFTQPPLSLPSYCPSPPGWSS